MVEQEPSFEKLVWRLDERQQHIRSILAEHRKQIEELNKQLAELVSKVQWLEWQLQEDRAHTKALAPLAHRVSALDSWVVKLVIGAALSAFLGMAFGNFAIFGDP